MNLVVQETQVRSEKLGSGRKGVSKDRCTASSLQKWFRDNSKGSLKQMQATSRAVVRDSGTEHVRLCICFPMVECFPRGPGQGELSAKTGSLLAKDRFSWGFFISC